VEERCAIASVRGLTAGYELIHGENVDVNAIAQNARTSTEMVDRFYGSQLEGEMNIGKIQSDIRKISKNERLSVQGSDAKHGADAALDRDLAAEIELMQRNEQSPQLAVVGDNVVLKA
jgi:hypothetical protein